MVRSMTGYGRAQSRVGSREITVEIKAVNHRFFEFSARVPRSCGYLEEKLKKKVGVGVSRGKVEVAVMLASAPGSSAAPGINIELARGYVEDLRALCRPLDLIDDLTLSSLIQLPDLFSVKSEPESEDEVWSEVEPVLLEALENFVSMREREGERLRADIWEKLQNIERYLKIVEERSPETVAHYRERLTAKLQEVLEGRSLDEGRIITEAAIYSERVAVDEETVRLRSHLSQFEKILSAPEAIGRKLDFLVQEINRETNTIGSKSQSLEINSVVVEMKSEIEKIREQIQNIE